MRKEVEADDGRDNISRDEWETVASMDGVHRRRRCGNGLKASAAEQWAVQKVG